MFNAIANLIAIIRRRRNRSAAVARIERVTASVHSHERPANLRRAA